VVPRAGRTIGLCGFVIGGLDLLTDVGIGLVDGRVRNYGFGTDIVLRSENPHAFWGLIAFWLVVGSVMVTGCLYAIRTHLKAKSSPDCEDNYYRKRLGLW
jgi:hypothetical protein